MKPIRTITRPGAALLCAGAMLASGCARSVVTTTVRPDGAFTRKIVFHAPAQGEATGAGLPGSPTLKTTFDMPAGGPWRTRREITDSEEIYTAERDLAPGAVQKADIAVKSGDVAKPGTFVVNEAVVRSVGPGRWEYRETLHWAGHPPDVLTTVAPELAAAVRSALSPASATDANIRPIGIALNREVWRMLFGPGDPFIASWTQVMMQPEVVERKMTARMSAGLLKAVTAQLGNRLTMDEQRLATRKIIANVVASFSSKAAKQADPSKGVNNDFGDAALAALSFSVKLPGRIISTNGERNDVDGEVYWSVFPQAAATGDVEMTAVCDTNP